MTEETEFDPEEARLRQVGEQQDSFEREHEDDPLLVQIGYERGVKQITGREAVGSCSRQSFEIPGVARADKGGSRATPRTVSPKGFHRCEDNPPPKRVRCVVERGEIAQGACKAGSKRRKRGRVKSKNDKRLGGRPSDGVI